MAVSARRRLGVCLTAALLVLAAAMPAEAKYASVVMDADTGQVIHEINADTRNYPASLTKMMTLYLVFEALETRLWSLDTPLRVSARAAQQPSSRLGMHRGDRIKVESAILALVTKSANDVATVVAENMSGSERAFALKMTAKAREMGMNGTTFRNASGLPHRAQMSTARDMAILARALIRDYPRYYHYFSIAEFRYDGATHVNHNKLLNTYDGVDGIKTGYINASGFNLVASAKRDGHRVIGVIFGGNSPNSRNALMTRLLNLGFKAVKDKPAAVIARADEAKSESRQVSTRKDDGEERRDAPATQLWAVQVGAFAGESQAMEAARQAIGLAPEQLSTGAMKVVPLKKSNGRVLHRARIEGISKKQAYSACKSLKRQKMNCMEMRLPDDYQMAANES
jgi:D-alanyl-D-alanine carboxypeptidase